MEAHTADRSPERTARAIELDEHGATSLWFDQARALREHVGFAEGWITTVRVGLAMASAALAVQVLKHQVNLQRPFQLDDRIQPLGPVPSDTSFPSGHAAAAAAAASVLADADPSHASSYEALAHEVAAARVYSGMHTPSDVAAGAQVGESVGRLLT